MNDTLIMISIMLELFLIGLLIFGFLRMRKLTRERNALIKEREVMFGFVHDVGEVFADADSADLDLMLKRIIFYALRTSHASAGAIYMFDKSRERLFARAISGIFPPLTLESDPGIEQAMSKSQHIEKLVTSTAIQKGEGLIGEVADFGMPILIEDAERDPRVPKYSYDFLKIRSLLMVPMIFHQQVLGVMAVINRVDGEPFIQGDLNLLQALADQASVSIHFAELRETLDEKQRLDHDLNVARNIQTSLLPKHIPKIDGLELAAFNHPALQVGGDYYDFIPLDEHSLGIALADVSGKSISGAIMMTICRGVLRSHAQTSNDPAEVLRAVNRQLRQDLAEDMFVSMLYMVINTQTGELQIARAGHEHPVLARSNSAALEAVEAPGIAIGIGDADTFDRIIATKTIQMKKGDVLVGYTDGVTEAMNAEGEEWGVERFFETVQTSAAEGSHSVLNNVQQRLLRFVGDVPQYDDMTLLALRVMS